MVSADERSRIDSLPTPLLRRAANPVLLLSGAANVVMQLSRPEIGEAVSTSTEPGALRVDPDRRRRTTVGYLAVAAHGTAEERAAFRRGVNASHAPVPGAMDADLQWWVAACLHRAFEESYELVHGPLDAAGREALLRESVVLGGLLQVPASAWPTSRAGFEERWREELGKIRVDDPVRDYLLSVIRLEYLPQPPAERLSRWRLRLTTGFLPPEFRTAMRLSWTPGDEAWFARFRRRSVAAVRRLPQGGQEYPFRSSMAELRERLGAGEGAV